MFVNEYIDAIRTQEKRNKKETLITNEHTKLKIEKSGLRLTEEISSARQRGAIRLEGLERTFR